MLTAAKWWSRGSVIFATHPDEGEAVDNGISVDDEGGIYCVRDFEVHGVGRMPVIELGGVYDDTAGTGPNALFAGRVPEGPATASRTLAITWGSTKKTTVETILLTYRRTADKNGLTRWLARIQPTGAVTEA